MTQTLLIQAALLVCLLALAYFTIVPASHQHLGNLPQSAVYRLEEWTDEFADLPDGTTHFHVLGPVNGKRIVFIHGITSPPLILHEFINLLANSGFRVLCYDLYGRGFSDSPGVPYTKQLYVNQLSNLLRLLNWNSCTVIGYSMGGAIATLYTDIYPLTVDRLVLVAPAGLMKSLPLLAQIARMPFLGELLMHTIARRVLVSMSLSSIKPESVNRLVKYREMNEYHIMHHPGLIRAYHSTLVNFPMTNMEKVYSRVGKSHENRILCIWGKVDTVVPFICSENLREMIPSVRLVVKDEAGHGICIEEAKFTSDQIVEFLK